MDLRPDPPDSSGDRCAGDSSANRGGCAPGDHADGLPSRRRTEIGPVDLGPCDHLPGRRGSSSKTGGRLHQGGIRGQAPVCGHEFPVGNCEVFCFDHRTRSPPQKLGAVGSQRSGDTVQFLDEVVIQLYKYLTAGHDHMLIHIAHSSDSTAHAIPVSCRVVHCRFHAAVG